MERLNKEIEIELKLSDLMKGHEVLDLTEYPKSFNDVKKSVKETVKFLHGRIGLRKGWFPREYV